MFEQDLLGEVDRITGQYKNLHGEIERVWSQHMVFTWHWWLNCDARNVHAVLPVLAVLNYACKIRSPCVFTIAVDSGCGIWRHSFVCCGAGVHMARYVRALRLGASLFVPHLRRNLYGRLVVIHKKDAWLFVPGARQSRQLKDGHNPLRTD